MPRGGGDPLRSDATFIGIEVDDDAAADAALAAKLAEVCPVDIYGVEHRRVILVEENLDECVLCGLCLDAAPPGAVRVLKLYDDAVALERS
jgi:NAD-dependent dihydropyrimidine dehydrogenase PreA subunit